MGESLVVHQKSMLERKVLGIGKDETNLSFGSSISHPLFEDDTFENLMKGAQITSSVKVVAGETADDDINIIPVEFDEEETEEDVYESFRSETYLGDGGDLVVVGGVLENIVGPFPLNLRK